MHGNLKLELTAYGGAHIKRVCEDAVELAAKLGIDVWFEFNGVHVLARPDDHPLMVEKAWDEALSNHSSHAATRR